MSASAGTLLIEMVPLARPAGEPFRPPWLGASERSAGKTFREAAAWRLPDRCPDDVSNRVVDNAKPGAPMRNETSSLHRKSPSATILGSPLIAEVAGCTGIEELTLATCQELADRLMRSAVTRASHKETSICRGDQWRSADDIAH